MLIFSAAKVIKKLETTKDFELKNVNYGNFFYLATTRVYSFLPF